MAHSFLKIFVPNLGSGVLVPTLPIGKGIGDEAVNITHASDDVTPELAPVQPFVSTAPVGGVIMKSAPGAILRCSAQIGATSGYLVLLDTATGITGNNIPIQPIEAPLWIESDQTAGYGVLEFRRGLKCNIGCAAVFTVSPNPLIYTAAPAGSLALFFGQVA